MKKTWHECSTKFEEEVPKEVRIRVFGENDQQVIRFLRFMRDAGKFSPKRIMLNSTTIDDVFYASSNGPLNREKEEASDEESFLNFQCNSDSGISDVESEDIRPVDYAYSNGPWQREKKEASDEDLSLDPSDTDSELWNRETEDSNDFEYDADSEVSDREAKECYNGYTPRDIVFDATTELSSDEKEQTCFGLLVVKLVSESELQKEYLELPENPHVFVAAECTDWDCVKQEVRHRCGTASPHLFGSSASRQQKDAFFEAFCRYITSQLLSHMNILENAKMPQVKQCDESTVRGPCSCSLAMLELMLQGDGHHLSADINSNVINLTTELRGTVDTRFRYSKELEEQIQTKNNDTGCVDWHMWCWRTEWVEPQDSLGQKCIEQIQDFLFRNLTSKLIKFLREHVTSKKHFVTEEALDALQVELRKKTRSTTCETDFSSSIRHEKMIYQSFKNFECDILEFVSNYATLKDVLPSTRIQPVIEAAVNIYKGSIHGDTATSLLSCPLLDKRWILSVADAYLWTFQTSNIGKIIVEFLHNHVRQKCNENADEHYDIKPIVKVLQDVFLKSFLLRRSVPVMKQDSRYTDISLSRAFACSAAMRIDILMSLDHRHLQTFLGVEMLKNDSPDLYSLRLFFPSSCISFRQLMSSKSFLNFDLQKRISWLRQVTEGLCVLHDHNIPHGALGLDTVLIRGPSALLAGPAVWPKATDSVDKLFQAPELSFDFHEDLPVDIYALGVLLWYFVRGTCGPEMQGAAADLPIPDSPLNADHLWSLFRSCCAESPEMRPTSKAVLKQLEGVERGHPATRRKFLQHRGV